MIIKLQYRDKPEYRSQRDWYGSGKGISRKKKKPKGEYDIAACVKRHKTKSGEELLREVMDAR